MHFMVFDGVFPKIAPKALKESNAVIAENLDIYGTNVRPHQTLGGTHVVLDVTGTPITGRVETLYKVGKTLVAFESFTTIADDPIQRLGEHSFLFVMDNVLYRQSEQRILQKLPPIKVGIDRPSCKTEPTAEVVPEAGCKEEAIEQICPANTDETCNTDGYPPQITAYKFTYVNQCHEESADSNPSNFVDVHNGDAVKIVVDDTPPENAVARRWYRAVADANGVTNWLYVGTSGVTDNIFYDVTCPLSWGNVLDTENDTPPPTCITGVSNIGNLRTILWAGNTVYVSSLMKPHAYPANNVYNLRYDILRIDKVTERIEGSVSYQNLVLTKGLHYRLTYDEGFGVSEVETRFPITKPEMACATDVAVYFLAKSGICEFTVQGIKLISGDFFTEREFGNWVNQNSRPVHFEDRIFIFGDRSFIFTLGGDERRDPSLSTLSIPWDIGLSTIDNRLVVYKSQGDRLPLIRWWGEGQEKMRGVWRSKPIMMSGFWRPVALKVISSEYVHKSVQATGVRAKCNIWKKTHPGLGENEFLSAHPEYEKYRAELLRVYPSVEVVLFADGKEYYRRYVSSGRPFLIPRKHRALDWQVEVRSHIVVDEIHIQTSRESLLSED